MIVQAVLRVHLLSPPQIAGSQNPPEAAKLLQSAIALVHLGDARMRKRDDGALPLCRLFML